MDSYIVRIYRRDPEDPERLIGLVEIAGTEGTKAFTSREELWGILGSVEKKGSKRIKTFKAYEGG